MTKIFCRPAPPRARPSLSPADAGVRSDGVAMYQGSALRCVCRPFGTWAALLARSIYGNETPKADWSTHAQTLPSLLIKPMRPGCHPHPGLLRNAVFSIEGEAAGNSHRVIRFRFAVSPLSLALSPRGERETAVKPAGSKARSSPRTPKAQQWISPHPGLLRNAAFSRGREGDDQQKLRRDE